MAVIRIIRTLHILLLQTTIIGRKYFVSFLNFPSKLKRTDVFSSTGKTDGVWVLPCVLEIPGLPDCFPDQQVLEYPTNSSMLHMWYSKNIHR